MRHKVSLWIVIALIGALAATSATIVVLATDDGRGGAVAGRTMPTGPDGEWRMPVAGDGHRGSDDGRDGSLVPWLLCAIATGTAVGLLIAWSPWRTAPAPAGGEIAGAGPVAAAGTEVGESADAGSGESAGSAEDTAATADVTAPLEGSDSATTGPMPTGGEDARPEDG